MKDKAGMESAPKDSDEGFRTSASLLGSAVRNSVFSGLGTISTFLLGFVFAGLTIRFLGEERGGYLMTLQAVIGLNALIGGFGLETPALRRIAFCYSRGEVQRGRAITGSVLTINIGTALMFSLLIAGLSRHLFAWSRLDVTYSSDAHWATLFVAGSFLLSQSASPCQMIYQAKQRYDLITGLTTIFGLLAGISGILVLKIAPSMAAIAVTGFGISLLRLVCDLFVVKRLVGHIPSPSWEWSEIRPVLGFGGWTYLSSLGGFLFTNADRLILTTLLGSSAMPYYVIPQRLYSQIHSTLSGQTQFLFPMLSSFGKAATDQIERLEDRLRWYMALSGGAVYTGMAFLGPPLLSVLIGPDFAEHVRIPIVLAAVQGFFHAQMIFPYFSSWAIGKGAPNTVAQLANGTLVVLTALVLIPWIGYVGASLSQLWIILIAVAHTVWVRRISSRRSSMWGWLRSYTSPCLMIVAWIVVVRIGQEFVSPGSALFYGLVLLAGVFGVGIVWMVEQLVFPARERWGTLKRAIAIPIGWIKDLIHKAQDRVQPIK
jgi:O-antigen/teichoic acid export membrane protein